MLAMHIKILSACALLLLAICLALFWRCGRLERALRAARAAPDQLLQDERRRIASDIHDDLGQNLLTLKLELIALHGSFTLPAQVCQRLDAMREHMDATVRSLRGIIGGLHPVGLEHGLRSAIERQLHEFSRINGIQYQLESAQYANDNASPADATLFRVLQESLSNIVRHAGATEVRIALCRNAQQLSMTVRDNGVGMDAGPVLHGCGLLGIQQRVASAGGCFSLSSVPGQGTDLSVTLPTTAAANQALFVPEQARRQLQEAQ